MATTIYTRPDGTKVDIRDLTEEMVREDLKAKSWVDNEDVFKLLWSSIIDERNKATYLNDRLAKGETIEDITKNTKWSQVREEYYKK